MQNKTKKCQTNSKFIISTYLIVSIIQNDVLVPKSVGEISIINRLIQFIKISILKQ